MAFPAPVASSRVQAIIVLVVCVTVFCFLTENFYLSEVSKDKLRGKSTVDKSAVVDPHRRPKTDDEDKVLSDVEGKPVITGEDTVQTGSVESSREHVAANEIQVSDSDNEENLWREVDDMIVSMAEDTAGTIPGEIEGSRADLYESPHLKSPTNITQVPESHTTDTNVTQRAEDGQKIGNNMPNSSHDVKAHNAQLKTILFWKKFFYSKDYGFSLGTHVFENIRCPHKCNLIIDEDRLGTADAVVVHPFHLVKDLSDAAIPKRASLEQIFVFFLFENPERCRPGLENLPYDDLFNLTMTYLDDPATDIYAPYGSVIKKQPYHVNTFHDIPVPTMEAVSQKDKSVTWLVSNCAAPSSRYAYVNLLSRYIDVDVLGKCGKDSCPKGSNCMQFLSRQYLFYLAFENGYCKDYVTEKTFRTLQETDMVPIVLGGANYTKLLPRHSFIDVRDFNSPEDLAKHLRYLKDNPSDYLKYFEWRKDEVILHKFATRNRGMCTLCSILNDADYPYKKNFKPFDYWSPSLCKTGEDEKDAVHIAKLI